MSNQIVWENWIYQGARNPKGKGEQEKVDAARKTTQKWLPEYRGNQLLIFNHNGIISVFCSKK